MRTESRVVMFTDIKGYTATTVRQTREENARLLALHDALVYPVIRAFGGRRVKTMGDAFLVLFAAPTEALLCAMALQDRLWEYRRRAAEARRIEIRIALAAGEVRLARGDVFGDAVNLAARVEAEAEPGEIWFTEALYWTLDRRHVPFEEVGHRALKGFPDPVRLFRVPAADGADAPPFRNAALDLVAGVAPPDPAALEKAVDVRPASGSRAGPALRLAAVALVLAAGAAGGWWLRLSPAEKAIRGERWDEAKLALDRAVEEKGADDADVLFLRGRYEQARADAGAGGSLRAAFSSWSRALAAGSGDALSALEDEARSRECGRRTLAARALVDSRSADALGALMDVSERDPAPPPAANPVAAIKQALSGASRCAAGDVARDGLAALRRR